MEGDYPCFKAAYVHEELVEHFLGNADGSFQSPSTSLHGSISGTGEDANASGCT